jgi:hypothetical protein
MGDFLLFQPGASLVGDLGWQSSLFLAPGDRGVSGRASG